MLDFWSCECGGSIPIGERYCLKCGADIFEDNIETPLEKKYGKFALFICFIWLFSPCFLHLRGGEEFLSSLIVAFSLPIALFILFQYQQIKEYKKRMWKVANYNVLYNCWKNGDTNLDKYFGTNRKEKV